MKKFVVLEYLCLPNRGLRFFTINDKDCEKLLDRTIAYKKILETDSTKMAQAECQRFDTEKLPTQRELIEYYKNKDHANELRAHEKDIIKNLHWDRVAEAKEDSIEATKQICGIEEILNLINKQ